MLILFLALSTGGVALTIVENTLTECGLEAWRRLNREYATKTPQSAQQILAEIVQPGQAKAIGNVSEMLVTWDLKVTEYFGRTSKALDDDLKGYAVRAIMPKGYEEALIMSGKHTQSDQVLRDHVRRPSIGTSGMPMTAKTSQWSPC